MISIQIRKIKFIITVFGLLCSFNSIAQNASTQKAEKMDDYKLVWSDEFNNDGPPDTQNWRFENGFVRNEEVQWYQPDNARCEGGKLIIEGRKEEKPNPNYIPGSNEWKKQRKNIEYTSSSINTSGKHSWQYGRFIMRARIDVSPGLWPAWWTLGVNGKWPSNGEIDIMEYYSNKLLANIACGTHVPNKAEWFSKTKPVDSLGGSKWASEFHIWRMDWDENSIALYVDDSLMNKVELSKLVNKDGTGINPFKQPHYMLLNLAMGGKNGGELVNTKFPNRYEIDYVRVYQKK
jgi:beta-glucanase (GH16 family)